MKQIFDRIWEKALPYQDKRNDKGHAKITLQYAKKLIKLEEGNQDIIIPSIILHDIGWSQISFNNIKIIFDLNTQKDELLNIRYWHQKESVKLSTIILHEVNYPSNLTEKILEIISEHDTRKDFLSKEDGLTRDADKLWRYSKIGFNADLLRISILKNKWYEYSLKEIETKNFFYSKSAKSIAHKELELRKKECF